MKTKNMRDMEKHWAKQREKGGQAGQTAGSAKARGRKPGCADHKRDSRKDLGQELSIMAGAKLPAAGCPTFAPLLG